MTSTSRKHDAAAGWHWGVLSLLLVIFLSLAAAAAIRGEWFAVAFAFIGLGVFGRSAWTKYRLRQKGSLPTEVPSDEAHANSLTPRVVVLVILLGLLHPLYILRSSLTALPVASLWSVFLLLWVSGIVVAGVAVYLCRYVAHHMKRGMRGGRGDDV